MPRIASFILTAAAAFALFCAPPPARAQRPEAQSSATDKFERGKRLFDQGDFEGALPLLRDAAELRVKDADAWHVYGLALNLAYRPKEARKAFEKALKLRPDNANARTGLAYTLLLLNKLRDAERETKRVLTLDAKSTEAHYILGLVRLREDQEAAALKAAEAALAISRDFPAALRLKSSALVGIYLEDYEAIERRYPFQPKSSREERAAANASRITALEVIRPRLSEAVESLERLIELEPTSPYATTWREELETLRVYAKVAASATGLDSQDQIIHESQVTTKAVIFTKPDPGYPEGARQEGITGVVKMRAVLGADGQVKHIFVIRSPDHRLTQAAINSARKIKFTPSTKDGRPVSQFITLEYNFNIY